jgi:endonuclease YncB( thermonuclease family)
MGCFSSKEKKGAHEQPHPNAPHGHTDAPPVRRRSETEPTKTEGARLYLVAHLPVLYEKADCTRVYDGDTITLADQRRVRLLGIDTPEIKDREPFAEEAKEFTKRLCSGKPVYLVFGAEKLDKFGRLLAHVYVTDPVGSGAYLCVNEALVDTGLASYYGVGEDLTNKAQLLALQRDARQQRRGKWASFEDKGVFITSHGRCYHLNSCSNLANIHRTFALRISEALDRGLSPCRDCHP